ncbi:GTP cyclohydrolase I FolE2, partial [Klebsiella pneumoniae]
MSIAAKQTLCPGMLPDIQSTKGDGEGESLSWVGMEQIDLPIDIAGRPVSAK